MRYLGSKSIWWASFALAASACVSQTETPATGEFSSATYGSVGGVKLGQVQLSREDLINFASRHGKGWNAMVGQQFGDCVSEGFAEGVRLGTKTRYGYPTLYYVRQPYGAPSNAIASRVIYQLSVQETPTGVDFVEFAREGEQGVIAAKKAARTLLSTVSRDKFTWVPGCERDNVS